jgi:hypothetical protein
VTDNSKKRARPQERGSLDPLWGVQRSTISARDDLVPDNSKKPVRQHSAVDDSKKPVRQHGAVDGGYGQ